MIIYSSVVRSQAKFGRNWWPIVKLNLHSNRWKDIVLNMEITPTVKNIWSVGGRLCLAAAVYSVWRERNLRLFQNCSRSWDEILAEIKNNVRMKLSCLKVKESANLKMNIDAGEIKGCLEEAPIM